MNIMFKSLGSAARTSNYRPENHFPKLLLPTDLCLPQNIPGYSEGANIPTYFPMAAQRCTKSAGLLLGMICQPLALVILFSCLTRTELFKIFPYDKTTLAGKNKQTNNPPPKPHTKPTNHKQKTQTNQPTTKQTHKQKPQSQTLKKIGVSKLGL